MEVVGWSHDMEAVGWSHDMEKVEHIPGGCVQCHQVEGRVPVMNAHPTSNPILSWVQSHWPIWGVVIQHHSSDHRQGLQTGSKHQHLWNAAADMSNQRFEFTGQRAVKWARQSSSMETTIAVTVEGNSHHVHRAQ